MAAQGSVLDCSMHCHPKYRRSCRVYGMVAGLVVGLTAVVLLAATLPSSLCLLTTKPEPETGLGMGTGRLPGLERLARLREVQQQLQVQVAALEQALADTNRTLTTAVGVTNRSLAEMHKQWDDCRSQLDTVKGSVVKLEQQISQLQQHREKQEAVVRQLQEDNRALQEEVEQQKEQLEEVQRFRSSFQQQIQQLSARIWNIQSHVSSGRTEMPSGAAMVLSLLIALIVIKCLR